MTSVPTGTVTLAFLDVPEATSLAGRLPRETADALSLLDALVRRMIAVHQGYEATPGPSRFRVAFDDPSDALHFAIDVQRLLLQLPWPARLLGEPEAAPSQQYRGLRVRIALHAGAVAVRADVSDQRMRYFGAVPRLGGAVLDAIAPGQLVLTGFAYTLVRPYTGTDLVIDVLGTYAVEGVPVPLVRVLPAELATRAGDVGLPRLGDADVETLAVQQALRTVFVGGSGTPEA